MLGFIPAAGAAVKAGSTHESARPARGGVRTAWPTVKRRPGSCRPGRGDGIRDNVHLFVVPYKDPAERRSYNQQYHHDWYLKNRAAQMAQAKQQRKAMKSWLDEIRSGLQCARCPESHPACLDFHHRDATQKEFSVGNALRLGWGKERILAEIAKCVVLCSNCHRKEHWKRRQDKELAALAGVEPAISDLKGRRPEPLDDRAA